MLSTTKSSFAGYINDLYAITIILLQTLNICFPKDMARKHIEEQIIIARIRRRKAYFGWVFATNVPKQRR